jgi:hypothetical protein
VRAAQQGGPQTGNGVGAGMIAPVLCRTHSFNDFEMVGRVHEDGLRPRLVHLHTAECMITRPGTSLDGRRMVCCKDREIRKDGFVVEERLRGHLVKG